MPAAAGHLKMDLDMGSPQPTPRAARVSRRRALVASVRETVRSIREDDTAATEAILRLSRSHRALAPLALVIGAFAMLLAGVRILLLNWRLTLVQVLPAMLVWLAMYDLKAHVLRGKTFHVLRGPVLIPINLAIVVLTIAAYFLNALFAYAIVSPPPVVRDALRRARANLRPILAIGGVIGLALGFSTTVAPRWERPWFTLSLSIVVGIMMLTYVAVPARLIGIKPTYRKRDKLAATAISSGLSATVCAPPYLLGRLGLLMLGGSTALVIPGILVFAIGAVLQAGATGAVRALKLSASLLGGPSEGTGEPEAEGAAAAPGP